MDEAAEWFLRIMDGLSQPGIREWRKWLAKDEANAEAFDRFTELWRTADNIEELPWPSDESLVSDTYNGCEPLPMPSVAEQRSRQRRYSRRAWFGMAASIAVAATVGFLAFDDAGTENSSYRTMTAEHRAISLSDGSTITLGAQSEIVISYSDDVRRVDLRSGEAYFEVAEDIDRPFVVHAGRRTIRVLGTEFGINIGVRDIRVSVAEGQVRVEGPPQPGEDEGFEQRVPVVSNLVEGDVLDFNIEDSAGVVKTVDPKLTKSWLNGWLAYDGITLECVIADVNRYSEKQLIIGDEATKQLEFTGTIFSTDIDNWLDGLEKVFPVTIVPVDGHRMLLIRRRG
ncbi:MAG: FecR domain-containing protein [Woeseiaceae bacterium]